MKKKEIQSVEEALRTIEESAIIRGAAIMKGDAKKGNKYVPILNKALVYLYEHDSLAALKPLLSHSDFNVREYAAYALLPLFEDECRKVLLEIANGDNRIYQIQGLNAEMTLLWWDIGELRYPYQPDYGKKPSEEADKKFCEAFLSKHKSNSTVEKEESPAVPASLSLRLSKVFGFSLEEDDFEKVSEEIGVYILYDTDTHEIVFRVNTFANPYTQDVESVYQKRVERFKAFESITAKVSADKPSKLGFMQIVLTIHEEKATDEVLFQIKHAIDENYREWKPNACLVWFKVDYNGSTGYFEGEWWVPTRAVIKSRRKYGCYDFSDEAKYDEKMWEIVKNEFDKFETSDSFALISSKEFQFIWNQTNSHKISCTNWA